VSDQDELARKWAPAMGQAPAAGNQVEPFISGAAAQYAMFEAITSATNQTHFIYLLGWYLDENLPLSPFGKGSTIRDLFTEKAALGVQIRVMLWLQPGKAQASDIEDVAAADQPLGTLDKRLLREAEVDLELLQAIFGTAGQSSHFQIARWVNNLTTRDGRRKPGAAIVDWLTASIAGSHHQKLLIVKGTGGLVGLVGGVDINPDRVKTVHPNKGEPLHDVHCRVRGPAARDLIGVFAQRWAAHPLSAELDKSRGPLLGLREPAGKAAGNAAVRVTATFNYVKSDTISQYTLRRDACQVERSVRDSLLGAIRAARRFIYIEDQYLISLPAARALRDALKNVQHVTALISGPSISDLPRAWALRKAFIDTVRSAPEASDKFNVYYLVGPLTGVPGAPYTYVHAKTWMIDDEFAYIGSANVNNRGWSSDSEVGVCVVDKRAAATSLADRSFAQLLRTRLWAQHLGVDEIDVLNGVTSRKLWDNRPVGRSKVRWYDANAGKDDSSLKNLLPVELIDPDVDDLPKCASFPARLRQTGLL
jgi:phosphatidylserine/phosphatidylglycerophosphate/cardiolipin synthase-like enzyme